MTSIITLSTIMIGILFMTSIITIITTMIGILFITSIITIITIMTGICFNYSYYHYYDGDVCLLLVLTLL